MSGSFYQLNQKYNQLLALIQGLPTTHDLTEVLTAGDDAGGLDITNLNNIDLTTINGSAYPPVVPAPAITDTNIDANYYPVFVDAAGSSVDLRADISTTPFSVNPLNGNLNVADTLKLDQTAVAVGKNAGLTTQGVNSVAIGILAGQTSQGNSSVAIGNSSGKTTQGTNSVAIGVLAGQTTQVGFAVAIGREAGQTTQGASSVAIGYLAGEASQGGSAVAIGREAGQTSQGLFGVAIGYLAGEATQGANSVAIGREAGILNQHANTIVLNGTGLSLNTGGTDRFIVKPVRDFGVEAGFFPLSYNPTTGEIAYT